MKITIYCTEHKGAHLDGACPKTAGPFPLRMDAGRNPDMFVIVTNQGNHYATTYDPAAARLIVAGPEILAALRAAQVIAESAYHDNLEEGDILGTEECFRIVEMCRAAIARAEGR